MSIIAYLFLPASGATAKFLNEEERKLAHYRLQVDSSSVVDQKFNISEALEIFKHPTTWSFFPSRCASGSRCRD
jgi:hypothetical protein